MKFPKQKRYVNKENLKLVKSQPCIICGKNPPSDAHHLQTVKSGGGDNLSNLVAVCRKDHQAFHQQGVKTMTERYNLKIDLKAIYPFRTDV